MLSSREPGGSYGLTEEGCEAGTPRKHAGRTWSKDSISGSQAEQVAGSPGGSDKTQIASPHPNTARRRVSDSTGWGGGDPIISISNGFPGDTDATDSGSTL